MSFKPIFTYQKMKSTKVELNVCAWLKQINDPSAIEEYKWAYTSLLNIYNVRNGMTLEHIYDFEIIDSLNAELWHKNITGDRDRKVMSIQLERVP